MFKKGTTKMRKEVFIGRTVHDQLMEHFPGFIEQIFEEEPEPVWQFAGVSVRMDAETYDEYVHYLTRLVPALSAPRN
jgi:hypothetical protein